eukprot:396682_1
MFEFFFLMVITNVRHVVGISGIDLASTFDGFTCLKQTDGVDFMITRAWHSYGAFDATSIQNLKNAHAAGFNTNYTDVYLFPCTTTGSPTAKQQMTYMINNLSQSNAVYNMIWLDIEQNPDKKCSWSQYDDTTSCNFLLELAETGISMGKQVGIYSSHGEWDGLVFSSVSACSQASKYPLWYAHYDKNPSFDDWPQEKFGGWSTPTIKQYTDDVKYCGTGFDGDYRP